MQRHACNLEVKWNDARPEDVDVNTASQAHKSDSVTELTLHLLMDWSSGATCVGLETECPPC